MLCTGRTGPVRTTTDAKDKSQDAALKYVTGFEKNIKAAVAELLPGTKCIPWPETKSYLYAVFPVIA